MARPLEKAKRWSGVFSRTKQRIANNLGIIDAGAMNGVRKFRDDKLELFDSYYENRQYDRLPDWDTSSQAADGGLVPVRNRKPRIKYNLAKTIVDRVAAKLVGEAVYPNFSVEGDPDTSEYLKLVEKISGMRYRLMEPVKRSLAAGSSLVRYYLVDGTPKIESYCSKYCYPTFQPSGELEMVSIKYVYEDQNDRDGMGNPKKKWFRLDLTTTADIQYDSPDYKEGQPEPDFVIVEQVDHNLGWVQAEWFVTNENKFSPDGVSLIGDILDFIDEFCYSLSQSSQAVGYNQDPQLIINGMDEEELEELVRSAAKAWNLGRDGKAALLEGGMSGVEAAMALRDHMKQNVVDIVRVVLLDPEKIVGSAQSAKAMEVLHGPLIELIGELRPFYEARIKNLLIKISMTMLVMNAQGFEVGITIPQGWAPTSLDILASWPPLFPLTIEDIQKKVQAAATAKNAGFLSPESALKFIAKDFGIEDLEEELAKIDAAQKAMAAMNPFGTF